MKRPLSGETKLQMARALSALMPCKMAVSPLDSMRKNTAMPSMTNQGQWLGVWKVSMLSHTEQPAVADMAMRASSSMSRRRLFIRADRSCSLVVAEMDFTADVVRPKEKNCWMGERVEERWEDMPIPIAPRMAATSFPLTRLMPVVNTWVPPKRAVPFIMFLNEDCVLGSGISVCWACGR